MSWVTKHHRLAHLLLEAQKLVLEPRPVDRVDRPERLVHANGRDVLLDGQVREEADLLDHVADLAPELVRLAFEHTSSPEQDLARGQRDHAVDERHGRLARPRRTNKHTDLAGSDTEAQVLQRVPWLSRITLADVAQLKRRRLTVRR